MLEQLDKRRRDDGGFTLIELMVVVLIMGILAAIAIPTFLSTTKSAKNTAALSNAVNATTSEISTFATQQSFDSSQWAANPAGGDLDPALPWDTNTGDTAPGSNEILVRVVAAWGDAWANGATAATGTGGIMLLESQPKNVSECYLVLDDQVSTPSEIGYLVYNGGACSTITASTTAPTAGTPATTSASATPSATVPGAWSGFYNSF